MVVMLATLFIELSGSLICFLAQSAKQDGTAFYIRRFALDFTKAALAIIKGHTVEFRERACTRACKYVTCWQVCVA